MRRNCPNCVEKEKRIRQLEAALLRISNEAAAAGITVGQPSLVDLEGFRRLTKRETEVLQMLRSGRRVANVAKAMNLAPNTVRNHLKGIFLKLGVRSQAELIEALHG